MGHFDPKFQVKGGVPHQPFFMYEKYMNFPFIWYKNLGGNFVHFVTIHVCDGQTDRRMDGRTDGFTVAKIALHTMQRGKN